jgi:hypothetical protein
MDSKSNSDWSAQILTREDITRGVWPCRAVYEAWLQTWSDVFERSPLYSDAFTRQDEILALFSRGECAGMAFFRSVDVSKGWNRNDSYFGAWPDSAIRGLSEQGSRTLVCSFFTVTSQFRKDRTEISVKDLLLSLLVRHFLDSDCDVMTGNLRNSKGVNTLCFRWGASLLVSDVVVHGEKSDLVGFFRDRVRLDGVPEVTKLSEEIWNRKRNNAFKPIRVAA